MYKRQTPENTEIIDINNLKERKQKLKFTKMSACSHDYIYINLFDKENTVSLSLIHILEKRGKNLPTRGGALCKVEN